MTQVTQLQDKPGEPDLTQYQAALDGILAATNQNELMLALAQTKASGKLDKMLATLLTGMSQIAQAGNSPEAERLAQLAGLVTQLAEQDWPEEDELDEDAEESDDEAALAEYLPHLQAILTADSQEKLAISLAEAKEAGKLDEQLARMLEAFATKVEADHPGDVEAKETAEAIRQRATQVRQVINNDQGFDPRPYIDLISALWQADPDTTQMMALLHQHLPLVGARLAQVAAMPLQSALNEGDQAKTRAFAGFIGNLATMLQEFPLGNIQERLRAAVSLYQLCLEAFQNEPGLENYASTQNNLGNTYNALFNATGQADFLRQAEAAYHEALKVRTLQALPQYYASTQNNLGVTYNALFNATGQADFLRQAEAAYHEALKVRTLQALPQDYATTQNNLGVTYNALFNATGQADFLEQANQCYSARIETSSNLLHYQKAADTAKSQARLWVAAGYNKDFPQANSKALAAAQQSIAMIEKARPALLMTHSQAHHLEQSFYIYSTAIQVAWKAGEAEQAAYWSEIARARQVLRLLRGLELYPKLPVGLEVIQQEYLSRYRHLHQIEQRAEQLSNDLAQVSGQQFEQARLAYQQLETELTEFKSWLEQTVAPHDPDFVAALAAEPVTRQRLLAQLQTPGLAAVELFVLANEDKEHPGQTLAFIYTGTGENLQLEILPCPLFGPKQMAELFVKWYEAQNNYHEKKIKYTDLQVTLQQTLQGLYAGLIQPISARLQELGSTQLVLVPHQLLHLLPLHAVPIGTTEEGQLRYFEDQFPDGLSYAPSLSLWVECQERKQRRDQAGRPAANLLAISDPTGDLLHSRGEVERVSRHYPGAHRILGRTSVEEVLACAPEYAHILFSCHGYSGSEHSGVILASDRVVPAANQSEEKPVASETQPEVTETPALEPAVSGSKHLSELNVERLVKLRHFFEIEAKKYTALTVREIIEHVNLARCAQLTFSACDTRYQSFGLADEGQALVNAVLIKGAENVVATLWAVDDFTTSLLIPRFYENWLKRKMNKPKALQMATRWLRELTVEDLLEGPLSSELIAGYQDSETRAAYEKWHQEYSSHKYSRQYKPFSHPHSWAAFCSIGAD